MEDGSPMGSIPKKGTDSWDEHFQHSVLLGRGRSQTGGYGGWVRRRKFNALKKKVAGKQKGGRASFHDDIFS